MKCYMASVMRYGNFILCLIFLLLIGVKTEASDKGNNSYIYVDPFNAANVFLLDIKNKQVIVNDVGNYFSDCKRDGFYLCIANEDFAFVLPDKDILTTSGWDFNGIKFRNIGSGNIRFLESSIKVHTIVTEIKEVEYKFLYSENRGVVAIGMFDIRTKLGRTYLLSGQCGFAGRNQE